MIGNIFTVEVQIGKCVINVDDKAKYSVSLRMGRNASAMCPEKLPINSIIQFRETLKVPCTRTAIQANLRCSLAIFKHRENQQPKIIGMATINLQDAKSANDNKFQKYKIDQCPDKNASIEAKMHLHQQQNVGYQKQQPIPSTSSLAQIRDFHQLLNGKSNISDQNHQSKSVKYNQNISQISIPSQIYTPTKQINCQAHKKIIQSLKSQILQLNIKLKSYQNSLSTLGKQANILTMKGLEQNNNFLQEIITIQEKKNLMSNKFINQILKLLQIPINDVKIFKNESVMTTSNNNDHVITNKSPNSKNNNQNSQQNSSLLLSSLRQSSKVSPQYQQLKKIRRQRDQFFQLSQQLYNQVKAYKQYQIQLLNRLDQKQKLQVKNQQDKQKLKFQIKQLQTKLQRNNQQSKDIIQSKGIKMENAQLLKQFKQYQRKFAQSLKAIQQFKKDALLARQQVFQKEVIIQRLMNGQKITLNQSKSLIQSSSLISPRKNIDNNKLTQLLGNSIKQRQLTLNKLKSFKQIKSQTLPITTIKTIKNKIDTSYTNLLKGNISKEIILKQKLDLTKILDANLIGN